SSMAKRFLRHMDPDAWRGKRVVVFDTILEVKDDPSKTAKQNAKSRKWCLEGAAPKMKVKLEKKGVMCEDLWHFEVSGLHGPLMEGWEGMVRQCLDRF
ncbi:MAG TPA: hypothetical protein VLH13_05065, partial [Methanomassiliicoccales archaeon]|nr:hypothetical protein [Methanomassiliicoccales archaeon]